MTKKFNSGTNSTKLVLQKEINVLLTVHRLLHLKKVRFLSHANQRMRQRNIIFYEVLQALVNGKYIPAKDRFSFDYNLWQYCIEGKTRDGKKLRIGISFEMRLKTEELLLVITVIDLGRQDS